MQSRSPLFYLAGFALGAAAAARGQMHHVDTPQRVTRAVGVYEWTGELAKPNAARFVPVSLFIDGHFEDAGLYLARPVPFALQSGYLYTVERSGEPAGVLDLQVAERVVTGNALSDDNPAGVWYGFGKFTADAAPRPGPALHRTAHVGSIEATPDPSKPHGAGSDLPKTTADNDDGKPHMSRRTPGADSTGGSDSGNDQAPASGSSNSGNSGGSAAGSDSKTDSRTDSDDTDRPTLRRRDPSQDPSRRKPAIGGKAGTASVTAVGPAPGEDPDRPTLSHKTKAEEGVKELTGMPADLHQAVAVSDAVTRDPHPFVRSWEDPAERGTTLAALAALSRPRVAAYLGANGLLPSAEFLPVTPTAQSTEGVAANTENGTGAAPKLQRGKPTEYGGGAPANPPPSAPVTAKPKVTSHSPAKASKPARVAPLTLRNEQITGFTLSYGGLPTFVYTASVATAAAHPGDLPPAATHPTAFVTVVAQRLASGDLEVALSTVTDSLHLDRSPRLQLVDAVDPDASHRASLLFELRGSGSRQFALYRLTSARAENTFTSASIE